MSGAFVGTVPAEIPPLTKDEVSQIVRTLLTELNEKFVVNLDSNPSFDRNVPPPFMCHGLLVNVHGGFSQFFPSSKCRFVGLYSSHLHQAR
jgi:hypothetical protein